MAAPPEHPASIRMVEETEDADGWVFHLVVDFNPDRSRTLVLRLAWVDYNLWSPSGAARPEEVARAVILLFLENLPSESIPKRLDAARVRRVIPDADTRLPSLIRGGPP